MIAELADIKIPVALLDVYQFNPRSAGDIVLSMYELYMGGGVTKSFTAAFIFDGVAFHPYENEIEVTVQFGHDGENWVPDNTIKYDLTSTDVAFISSEFMSLYPGPADNVGYFGSFDRRTSSSNYWSDSMLLEAFNALLDDMDSSAEEGQKYVLKFVVYTGATGNETMSLIKTDGIVVLTGDKYRISEGIKILKKNSNERLLISGVNKKISKSKIISLYGNDPETKQLFDCCIDIDKVSTNTFENSREAYFWARDRQLKTLLIVTSNYHIPRVKLEFSRFFQENILYYNPVNITEDDESNISLEMIKKITFEYIKYLRTSLSFLVKI